MPKVVHIVGKRQLFKCAITSVSNVYCLQFKERDELARIFKSWMQPQSSSSIVMSKAWDYRVRQHLGTRYNSKNGCFDWDLAMKLHEKGVLLPKCASGLKFRGFSYIYIKIYAFICSVVSSTNVSMSDGGHRVWHLK